MEFIEIALLVFWAPFAISIVRSLIRTAGKPPPNLEHHFAWMALFGALLVPALIAGEDLLGVALGRLLVILLSLVTLGLFFTYNARRRRLDRLVRNQASERPERPADV